MTAFFSGAEELSGSVADPALLPSSSSRNARLRVDEELTCIMTKTVNELGLHSSTCVLSHPSSPPSHMILEIRIRRGGISIQGPAFWSVPGSPHFYTMPGCGSLPSATDGNPHTQLPRWLAHSEFLIQLSTQCRWQQLSQRSELWQFSTTRLPSGKVPPICSKLSRQSVLTEGDTCAGQNEPRSRHVVEEQCIFRRMDAPPARGSENLGSLLQSSSRPLRLQRQLSLSNLFYKEHGCPGPWMAQPSALCFLPSRSATAGTQASQGTAQAYSNSPPLEEPTVGVSYSSCWKQPRGQSPWDGTFSLKQKAMIWHPQPELWALYVLPLDGRLSASQSVSWKLWKPCLLDVSTLRNGPFSRLGVKTATWTKTRSPPMCQWFFHFCRRCWINSVPHPPSKFTRQP